jgi:protein-disulfide isomerase
MTTGEPAGPDTSLSKNERREAAREKAKELRAAQRRKEIRNRVLLQGGIIVAVLAVVAIVAVIVVSSIRPASKGPANMASDGIVIGQGLVAQPTDALEAGADPVPTAEDPAVAQIQVYVDYLCPFCGDFERANADQIESLLDSGAATMEIHPIAILAGRSAGTQYSLRAANAAACVADTAPDSFWEFNSALFADQPAEGTPGLTDDELVALAETAGASDVEDCIEDQDFAGWVQSATTRATTGPLANANIPKVEETPTILVNGRQYTGSLEDTEEFRAFVLQASSESYSTATPTPTPTSTPTPTPTEQPEG